MAERNIQQMTNNFLKLGNTILEKKTCKDLKKV